MANTTVTKTTKYDYDQNSTIDAVNKVTTVSHSDDGDVVKSVELWDWNNDGVWDSNYTTQNKYNGKDLMTKSTTKVDYDGDGKVNDTYTTDYKYNKDGHITQQTTQYDWGNDKDIDATYITKNGYDKQGHLVETLTLNDGDGNGTTDWQDKTTYVYNGDHLSQELVDWGNNGSIDVTTDYLYA